MGTDCARNASPLLEAALKDTALHCRADLVDAGWPTEWLQGSPHRNCRFRLWIPGD